MTRSHCYWGWKQRSGSWLGTGSELALEPPRWKKKKKKRKETCRSKTFNPKLPNCHVGYLSRRCAVIQLRKCVSSQPFDPPPSPTNPSLPSTLVDSLAQRHYKQIKQSDTLETFPATVYLHWAQGASITESHICPFCLTRRTCDQRGSVDELWMHHYKHECTRCFPRHVVKVEPDIFAYTGLNAGSDCLC